MKKIVLLLIALLWLAACAPAGGTAQPITLVSKDINYSTTTLEVTAGQPVALTLINEGVLEHDFSIEEIAVTSVSETNPADHSHAVGDLHAAVKPGETNVLNFTPTEPGTYEFYCTVAGHKAAGMVGTLIVK
ncbi:MAG: cupredoxin domain-containing protein [Anaerolineales bacterium]|nr:cupredoxin domain-containing protein [Anaerolineales bacterium]